MKDTLEKKLRNKLRQQGFALRKGRDAYNVTGYMIIDPYRNAIEAGERFDLNIYDVERFANE